MGFGLGAIQSGLFLHEAARSGNFKRLVVAEVMPDVVQAVRASNGVSLNLDLLGASGFVGGNRIGPGVIGMADKPGIGYSAGMKAPFVSRSGWSSMVSTKPCDEA